MKKNILYLLLLFAVVSCKKGPPLPNNGIYRGVFREIYAGGDTVASGVVYLAMFEENNTFSLVGDSTTNAPATHNGTYNIESGNNISYFRVSDYSPQFDTDHYLDTLYSYTFDDENFEFWFQDDTIKYEYRLSRD